MCSLKREVPIRRSAEVSSYAFSYTKANHAPHVVNGLYEFPLVHLDLLHILPKGIDLCGPAAVLTAVEIPELLQHLSIQLNVYVPENPDPLLIRKVCCQAYCRVPEGCYFAYVFHVVPPN